ncbi:MAG: DUF4931 domain-containing protein [Candidatus Margulisbacteria bacterium]|nr:DUF4931 domain-containing protein [Candidatus Margulisiibacteriota bacterium]
MSELRKDPLTNRWVIISQERSARPSDTKMEHSHLEHSFCPFCEGHEDKTPPEIMAIRKEGSKPNSPGWIVRVIPNKFPVMNSNQELKRYGIGMYDAMSGTGAHEVVVENNQHILNMADFDVDRIFTILQVIKTRMLDLYKDYRFRYALMFKNYGVSAGASLSHPHSQIIALPIVPQSVKVVLESAKAHYIHKERCIFCDVIKQELMTRERIVSENEKFLCYTPFASRFPFEMTIMPKEHNHKYCNENDDVLRFLAGMLKDVLLRLKIALNDPAYNIVLHSAPNTITRPGHNEYWSSIEYDFHWHLEIMPRLTKVAGFEWGTGFYINHTPPEDAAEFLRDYEKYMVI